MLAIDVFAVRAPVGVASRLFATTFHEFHHAAQPTVVRATGTYSLPEAISNDIEMVPHSLSCHGI